MTTTAAPPSSGLSAAEVTAYLALVQAQSAARQQLTDAAVAAVVNSLEVFTDWWDSDAITDLTRDILRQVQPAQRRAARLTDSYVARLVSKHRGRTERGGAAVDITRLRRQLPQELIERLARDEVTVPVVEIGDTVDGPNASIDDELEDLLALVDTPAEWRDPADAYGRIADQYRWETIANGASDEEALAKAKIRAEQVVDTDISLAVREQEAATAKRLGVQLYRRVLHPELAESGLSCGLCIVASDRVYSVAKFKREIHAHCVPAGTRVAAQGVLAVTRRKYSGQLVVLFTASGQEVTVTPNHPVLTSQGWIPAGLVGVGDDVVRHLVGHGVVGRGPEEGDGPPLIEEVWGAASVQSALHLRSVPLSAEDFHGDGADGEVDVVAPGRDLPRMGDVSFGQPCGEAGLVCRHGRGPQLASQSLLDDLLLGGWLAPQCGVGGGDEFLPVRERRSLVPMEAGVGAAAALDPGFLQDPGDRTAADTEPVGQGEFGRAAPVGGDDLVCGEVVEAPPPRFDPAVPYGTEDGVLAYAELGGKLLDRLAGSVALDRVVEKRLVDGTHEVFNLHTAEGWYSADSYIVSNCHCEMVPIEDGKDPALVLNQSDLDSLYAAAGKAVGSEEPVTGGGKRQLGALKRVRVGITEHGELGPILINQSGQYRTLADFAKTQSQSPKIRAEAQLPALVESLARWEAKRDAGETGHESKIRWHREQIARLRRIAGQ